MNHLRAPWTQARLTETPEPGSRRQAGLLGSGEMKESEGQGAAGIRQPDQQRTPAPEADLGRLHYAVDYGLLAWPEAADGYHPGPVLITDREVEQGVLHRAYAELRQALRIAGSHPVQDGDREVLQATGRCGGVQVRSRAHGRFGTRVGSPA